MRESVASLYAFMLQIDDRIKAFDRKITAIFKASDVCQRIAKIRGIGPTATEMIAAIGDGSDFKNGRHLAAWLGLVPPAFGWRSQSDDGYHQAWQSALEDATRTWCARSCPHSSEKNRLKKYVGQRTSPAARLLSRDGRGRQQELTDHLGRADQWRAVSRRCVRVKRGCMKDRKMG